MQSLLSSQASKAGLLLLLILQLHITGMFLLFPEGRMTNGQLAATI
jgi:hypothetical protein